MSRVRTHAELALLLVAFAWVSPARPQPTARVTVGGNVAQALTLTVADLKQLPARQFEYLPGGGEHMPKAAPGSGRRYTGCLLRDVLSQAKPTETAPRGLRKSYLVAAASDGYEVVFSWAELFISPVGDSVYVVYERDGKEIPDDEGRIALVALTDTRPARHVKWLKSLTLRAI